VINKNGNSPQNTLVPKTLNSGIEINAHVEPKKSTKPFGLSEL
jgi:hypothetical protein